MLSAHLLVPPALSPPQVSTVGHDVKSYTGLPLATEGTTDNGFDTESSSYSSGRDRSNAHASSCLFQSDLLILVINLFVTTIWRRQNTPLASLIWRAQSCPYSASFAPCAMYHEVENCNY